MTPLLAQVVIPQPDFVPMAAPPLLFRVLALLMFFLHLIPMNLVLGGTFLTALLQLGTEGGGRSLKRQFCRWAWKWMPVVIAAAITFGVATLLFVQVLYGRLLYTSSILIGGYWLAVIPLVIAAYYGTYLLAFESDSLGRWTTPLGIGVCALFVGVGFIYSNNMSQMLRTEWFLERYLGNPQGLTLNWSDPTLMPRYLHMFLGAVAVASMAMMLYGVCLRGRDSRLGRWAIRRGGITFAVATVANTLVGTWFLLSFPRTVLRGIMSGQLLGGVALAAGLVLGLLALACVILGMQSTQPRLLILAGAGLLVLTLAAMVLTRDQARSAAIAGAFQPTAWVEPQWGAILLFLITLSAGLAVSLWMVFSLARPRDSQPR